MILNINKPSEPSVTKNAAQAPITSAHHGKVMAPAAIALSIMRLLLSCDVMMLPQPNSLWLHPIDIPYRLLGKGLEPPKAMLFGSMSKTDMAVAHRRHHALHRRYDQYRHNCRAMAAPLGADFRGYCMTFESIDPAMSCLLYTSDAADE